MERAKGKRNREEKERMTKAAVSIHDTAAFAFRTKDILKIRNRPRLKPGSDYHYLVRVTGLEPFVITAIHMINTTFYPIHDKFHDKF